MMTATVPVTVYGASDDCLELETPDNSISEEINCDVRTCYVSLTAPNGDELIVKGKYGRNGWELGIYGKNEAGWMIEESTSPYRDGEPALIVHVPVGTVAEEVY